MKWADQRDTSAKPKQMDGSQLAMVMKHVTQSRTKKMWDADKEDKFTVEVRAGALFIHS